MWIFFDTLLKKKVIISNISYWNQRFKFVEKIININKISLLKKKKKFLIFFSFDSDISFFMLAIWKLKLPDVANNYPKRKTKQSQLLFAKIFYTRNLAI